MKCRLLSLSITAFLTIASLGTSCSQSDNLIPNPKADKIVSKISLIAHPTQDELKQRAAAVVGPAGAQLVKTGVRVWRVEYETKMPDGEQVMASGLIIVPDAGAVNLTMLSYQHGTQFNQESTISDYTQAHGESYVVGSVIAAMAKGYYVVMPDYLGYGSTKNKDHYYIHRQSLASASLDMLRAAKETATDSAIGLNRETILAGYSEGGYATMALHKMIDESAAGEFTISDSYPGAGPYDVTSTAKSMMQTARATDAQFVLSYAWVTLTYNKLYNINKGLPAYFTQPNIAAVQAFQERDLNTALSAINTNPTQLFAPDFISEILTRDHTPMLQAMKDNDIWNWKPSGHVVIMHSTDDEWVPVLNAQHAYDAMRAKEANVELVLLSGDHRSLGAVQYFGKLFEKLQ